MLVTYFSKGCLFLSGIPFSAASPRWGFLSKTKFLCMAFKVLKVSQREIGTKEFRKKIRFPSAFHFLISLKRSYCLHFLPIFIAIAMECYPFYGIQPEIISSSAWVIFTACISCVEIQRMGKKESTRKKTVWHLLKLCSYFRLILFRIEIHFYPFLRV